MFVEDLSESSDFSLLDNDAIDVDVRRPPNIIFSLLMIELSGQIHQTYVVISNSMVHPILDDVGSFHLGPPTQDSFDRRQSRTLINNLGVHFESYYSISKRPKSCHTGARRKMWARSMCAAGRSFALLQDYRPVIGGNACRNVGLRHQFGNLVTLPITK